MTQHPPPTDWPSLKYPPAVAWRYGGAWYREYPHIRDVTPNQQHLVYPFTYHMLAQRKRIGLDVPTWFSEEQD